MDQYWLILAVMNSNGLPVPKRHVTLEARETYSLHQLWTQVLYRVQNASYVCVTSQIGAPLKLTCA